MTVEVDIDGHHYRVELEHEGAGWLATINGRRVAIDAARTPGGWSLLVGQHASGTGDDDRRSYEVAVDDRGRGESTVFLNGLAIPVRLVDPRAWHRGAPQTAAAGASRLVTSAMPGRVVKVLVKAGDRVTARQGLVVVEAMKMENELRAPVDAVVREVKVTEGASVDAGAILVVLE